MTHLLGPDRFNSVFAMESVNRLYSSLPARFRDYTVPVTGNQAEDVYGFQAAMIQVTYQLVRMTVFSVDTDHDLHQKCTIAEDLLSTLRSICPRFFTLISTPLVYHLGGIGHILATVTEGPLTEASYQRVRTSLVSMADLLENLESGLQPTALASKGLHAQVAKIDAQMQSQRSSSTYASSVTGAPPISYPPGQRSIFNQHQPHAFNGVPATAGQFQVPQEVVSAWPWSFEPGNEPQHPVNMQGFNG